MNMWKVTMRIQWSDDGEGYYACHFGHALTNTMDQRISVNQARSSSSLAHLLFLIMDRPVQSGCFLGTASTLQAGQILSLVFFEQTLCHLCPPATRLKMTGWCVRFRALCSRRDATAINIICGGETSEVALTKPLCLLSQCSWRASSAVRRWK